MKAPGKPYFFAADFVVDDFRVVVRFVVRCDAARVVVLRIDVFRADVFRVSVRVEVLRAVVRCVDVLLRGLRGPCARFSASRRYASSGVIDCTVNCRGSVRFVVPSVIYVP